jgi:hypothetical protein
MTVELLYLPDCPNHEEAADLVRSVLEVEGFNAKLIETPVFSYEEAKAHGFPGSPTLRVNGQDIEGTPSNRLPIGFACRLYSVRGKQQGIPPRVWLEQAIRTAQTLEKQP